MRSRVLFIDHVAVLGGAELSLVDVARAYRDTSTFLLLADGPYRERLTREGVRVEVMAGGEALKAVRRETHLPSLGAASRLVSIARRVARRARDHDVIHANTQKSFVIGCMAGILAGRPVIWDLNDMLTPAHFSRTNIRVGVFFANRVAARVIANSRASAEALIAQGGRRDKVRVVHNGISADAFDAVTEAEVSAVRRELGLNDAPAVGVFGRLAPWKGQDVALEAIAAVPDVHLLLVGDALFGEHAYADTLRSHASRLGMTGRVHFLGFRSDIARLMRVMRIVLHTSTAPEPFGRVIVEGMLAERPVIATSGGGVEEIVDDGVTGLLVPPGQPAALAAAVRTLLADPLRAQQIAAAGRAVAETRFSVDAMVNAMTGHIEDVARRHSRNEVAA